MALQHIAIFRSDPIDEGGRHQVAPLAAGRVADMRVPVPCAGGAVAIGMACADAPCDGRQPHEGEDVREGLALPSHNVFVALGSDAVVVRRPVPHDVEVVAADLELGSKTVLDRHIVEICR